MLFIHLAVALTSIIVTGSAVARPSRVRLRFSYLMVVLTIISGTFLVGATHSPMLSACISGLVFIGVSLIAIVIAQRRLVGNEEDRLL